MHRNIRKDIQSEVADYSFISFFSRKLRIGIIGGGKAGSIKARHFVNNKCYVEILSKKFSREIEELSKTNDNLVLIDKDFYCDFLKDKHVIIIALNDVKIKKDIVKYCKENYKIYIDCTEFSEGMAVVPVERNSKNINIALNTKRGNPRGAVWAADNIKEILADYDEYIDFTTKIRNKAKSIPEHKKEIIEFLFSDEFKKEFDMGKGIESIKSRFSKEIVDGLI